MSIFDSISTCVLYPTLLPDLRLLTVAIHQASAYLSVRINKVWGDDRVTISVYLLNNIWTYLARLPLTERLDFSGHFSLFLSFHSEIGFLSILACNSPGPGYLICLEVKDCGVFYCLLCSSNLMIHLKLESIQLSHAEWNSLSRFYFNFLQLDLLALADSQYRTALAFAKPSLQLSNQAYLRLFACSTICQALSGL